MKKVFTVQRIIFIILTIAVMVIIFIFSCENSDKSSDTSGRFVKIFVNLFIKDFDSMSSAEQTELYSNISHLIRKTAHFTIYMMLGFFSSFVAGRRKLISAGSAGTVGFCFLYAVSDEIHQYFVPGRACMFTDMLLDTCGGFTGMLISLAVMCCLKRKRKSII